MFWEYEITYFPHKNDLTVCFPEGNPRAFPCIGHPLGIGTTQAYRLPSRLLWYDCAIRYGKTVSIAMINLYQQL